jgi:hypothetical protein
LETTKPREMSTDAFGNYVPDDPEKGCAIVALIAIVGMIIFLCVKYWPK